MAALAAAPPKALSPRGHRQGAATLQARGLALHPDRAALHLVIMPAMGIVPAPWHQQFQQHLSEAPGHAVWMWVIELTRRDLRNRITHEPDPEVPLTAAFR